MLLSLLLCLSPSIIPGNALPIQGAKVPPAVFRKYDFPVTTWIPPYAVAKSKAQLTASFGSFGPKDGLTHLGLQFWVPTLTGGVQEVGFSEVNDAAVKELRDWAHSNGIRAMLTIFNGEKKWDWPLAKAAFADHREEFTKNLITEMDRMQLDGIDVDLEGPGDFDGDKAAFLAFMTDLSMRVHERKKQLSVSTFAYKWNAPCQTWWPDLLPLVDALSSMGYEETGMAGPEWRSYASQVTAAGSNSKKLQLGMPGDRDKWQGSATLDQVQWVKKDGRAGIAIWDAQLNGAPWRTADVWRVLRDLNSKTR